MGTMSYPNTLKERQFGMDFEKFITVLMEVLNSNWAILPIGIVVGFVGMELIKYFKGKGYLWLIRRRNQLRSG